MLNVAQSLSVNLTTGVITQSDIVSARSSLPVTLTGTGSLVNTNMRMALYRRLLSGVDGTLVATCSSFTGPLDAFSGSLNLNTDEVVSAFTDLQSVRQGEKLAFDMLIYDNSQDVYMVWDKLNVSYEHDLVAGTPGSVTPITSGTAVWGDIRLYAGSLYKYSITDGLWYKWYGAGAGTTIHEELSETGISLP
jgi:hypothetical protein